jgi:membrane fusion protein (multidrug efflux system)
MGKRSFDSRNAFWAAAFCVALALTGCDNGITAQLGGDNSKDEEPPPVPVEVRQPSRGDVFAVYSGTASLETDQEAVVIAKVGGEVTRLFVEEGATVSAGDVLARLDGDRLKLEMQRSLANVRKLEQEYERNLELHEKGLVSAGAFEGIKYELDSLRAAYSLAKLELSYTEIVAPINGVVSERMIKVGNTISINDPAFRITDMDPLLAYLFVPEKEFRKLRPGQPAQMTVDAISDREFNAEILRISPTVDPATGTFKVTLAIVDGGDLLKPGMFGRFRIVFDSRTDTLLVPRLAIIEDESEKSVFVVESGKARRQKDRPDRPERRGIGESRHAGTIWRLEARSGSRRSPSDDDPSFEIMGIRRL